MSTENNTKQKQNRNSLRYYINLNQQMDSKKLAVFKMVFIFFGLPKEGGLTLWLGWESYPKIALYSSSYNDD